MHVMNVYGGVYEYLHSYLHSAPDGAGWSDLPIYHHTYGKKSPSPLKRRLGGPPEPIMMFCRADVLPGVEKQFLCCLSHSPVNVFVPTKCK